MDKAAWMLEDSHVAPPALSIGNCFALPSSSTRQQLHGGPDEADIF